MLSFTSYFYVRTNVRWAHNMTCNYTTKHKTAKQANNGTFSYDTPFTAAVHKITATTNRHTEDMEGMVQFTSKQGPCAPLEGTCIITPSMHFLNGRRSQHQSPLPTLEHKNLAKPARGKNLNHDTISNSRTTETTQQPSNGVAEQQRHGRATAWVSGTQAKNTSLYYLVQRE